MVLGKPYARYTDFPYPIGSRTISLPARWQLPLGGHGLDLPTPHVVAVQAPPEASVIILNDCRSPALGTDLFLVCHFHTIRLPVTPAIPLWAGG